MTRISAETIAALCDTKPPPTLPKAADFTKEIHELEAELGLPKSRPVFSMAANASRLGELRFLVSKLAQGAKQVAAAAPPVPVPTSAAPSLATPLSPPATATPAPPAKELHGLARFAAAVRLEGADTTPVKLHPVLKGRARMLHGMKIQGVKP